MSTLLAKNNFTSRELFPDSTSPSVGLAIPFHPSMKTDAELAILLSYTLELLEVKLDNYGLTEEQKSDFLHRAAEIFSKLNYETRRRAIAITIRDDSEKILYLGFDIKPSVIVDNLITFVDLIEPVPTEDDFYFLSLNVNDHTLFHYTHGELRKAYEMRNEGPFLKQLCNVLDFLTDKNDKPFFARGNPDLIKLFSSCFFRPEIFFEIIETKANEEPIISVLNIAGEWDQWHSKFLRHKINHAKKTNSLITGVVKVTEALQRNAEGVLLLRDHFHYYPGDLQTKKLPGLVEKFLAKGNALIRVKQQYAPLIKDVALLLPDARTSGKFMNGYRPESFGVDYLLQVTFLSQLL